MVALDGNPRLVFHDEFRYVTLRYRTNLHGEGLDMSGPSPEEAHNIDVVRRLFDSFAAEGAEVLKPAFAEDALFHRIPVGPLKHSFKGPQAIVDFLIDLGRQTDGTIRFVPVTMAASGARVLVLYRLIGTRNSKTIDINHVLVFTLAGGLITEAVIFTSDYETLASFWS
jgi:ketosteroid isomerase-like protein